MEAIWRGVMVRAGTPQPVVDTLIAAMEKMKQTKDWQDFSRLNMQSSVDVTLAGMQQQVRDEVGAYRAFLQHVGIGN